MYPTAPIPSFPNMLHRAYGRFSPEDEQAAGVAGFGLADQSSPKVVSRTGDVRSMSEAPSWLRTNDELKPQSIPARPMFSNTSSSSTLASSTSKPRPPLPPLPYPLPHELMPSIPCSPWPTNGHINMRLSRLPTPPSRENSSDTMRSVPLLSPPVGYATLPGGITSTTEPIGVYSYSPSPSVSPAPCSESSASERRSAYASPSPSPVAHEGGTGHYQTYSGFNGFGTYSGPGSLGSLTGPPPTSAQRKLRFAPLPPTPGSSLRASVFTPSPYPVQHTTPHSYGLTNHHHHAPAYPAGGVPVSRAQPIYSHHHPDSYWGHGTDRPPIPPHPHPLPPPPFSAPATSGAYTHFNPAPGYQPHPIHHIQHLPPVTMPETPSTARPQQFLEGGMQRQLDLLHQVTRGSFPSSSMPVPQKQPMQPWGIHPASASMAYFPSSRPSTEEKSLTLPPITGVPIQSAPRALPSVRRFATMPTGSVHTEPQNTNPTFGTSISQTQPGPVRFTSSAPHPSFWFPDGNVIFDVSRYNKFLFLSY